MAAKSGLRGVNKVRRILRRLPDEIAKPVRDEIKYGAELLHAEIMQGAPKDTGDMAAAASYKLGRDGLSAQIGYSPRWKRLWKLGGWYARFQEFGTKAMAAHPFIFPALERNRKHIVDRVRAAVVSVLDRVGRSNA